MHEDLESLQEPGIVPFSQKRRRSKEAATCPTQGIRPRSVHRVALPLGSPPGLHTEIGWSRDGEDEKQGGPLGVGVEGMASA